MAPKVSVIVPVYNEESRLSQCVDSVLQQSFPDWELLLIDDGSRDRSVEIARAYAADDARIRSFQNNGSGVSSARNFGLDRAAGQFVTFLDADDWLLPDYLEELCRAQEEHNADWTVCEFSNIREETGQSEVRKIYEKSSFFCGPERKTEVIDRILCNPGRSTLGAPFPKLFRRCIIEEHAIRFPDYLNLYEDVVFNFTYAQYMTSFFYLGKPLYCRRTHAASATHGFRPHVYEEMEAVFREYQRLCTAFDWQSANDVHFMVLLFYDIMHLNVFHPQNPAPRRQRYREFYRFLSREPMRSLWHTVRLSKCRGAHEVLKVFCMKTRQLGILELLYRAYYKK